MKAPDDRTRSANRRLLAGMAVFAVLFCAAIILWKAFLA